MPLHLPLTALLSFISPSLPSPSWNPQSLNPASGSGNAMRASPADSGRARPPNAFSAFWAENHSFGDTKLTINHLFLNIDIVRKINKRRSMGITDNDKSWRVLPLGYETALGQILGCRDTDRHLCSLMSYFTDKIRIHFVPRARNFVNTVFYM